MGSGPNTLQTPLPGGGPTPTRPGLCGFARNGFSETRRGGGPDDAPAEGKLYPYAVGKTELLFRSMYARSPAMKSKEPFD